MRSFWEESPEKTVLTSSKLPEILANKNRTYGWMARTSKEKDIGRNIGKMEFTECPNRKNNKYWEDFIKSQTLSSNSGASMTTLDSSTNKSSDVSSTNYQLLSNSKAKYEPQANRSKTISSYTPCSYLKKIYQTLENLKVELNKTSDILSNRKGKLKYESSVLPSRDKERFPKQFQSNRKLQSDDSIAETSSDLDKRHQQTKLLKGSHYSDDERSTKSSYNSSFSEESCTEYNTSEKNVNSGYLKPVERISIRKAPILDLETKQKIPKTIACGSSCSFANNYIAEAEDLNARLLKSIDALREAYYKNVDIFSSKRTGKTAVNWADNESECKLQSDNSNESLQYHHDGCKILTNIYSCDSENDSQSDDVSQDHIKTNVEDSEEDHHKLKVLREDHDSFFWKIAERYVKGSSSSKESSSEYYSSKTETTSTDIQPVYRSDESESQISSYETGHNFAESCCKSARSVPSKYLSTLKKLNYHPLYNADVNQGECSPFSDHVSCMEIGNVSNDEAVNKSKFEQTSDFQTKNYIPSKELTLKDVYEEVLKLRKKQEYLEERLCVTNNQHKQLKQRILDRHFKNTKQTDVRKWPLPNLA